MASCAHLELKRLPTPYIEPFGENGIACKEYPYKCEACGVYATEKEAERIRKAAELEARDTSPEEEDRVRSNRAQKYGPATFAHRNLGLIWTGILQNHFGCSLPHPIPPDVVLLMLGGNKINRAVLESSGRPDDYLDLRIYAQLAMEAREGKNDEA